MAEDCRSIECVSLHRLTPDVDESGAVLQRADVPAYFEALERERVIAAHDAHTDPRTCEFLLPYLRRTASAPCSTCRSGRTIG